jgi:hypothetical protein
MLENLRAWDWVFQEGNSLFIGYYGGPAESMGARFVLALGRGQDGKMGKYSLEYTIEALDRLVASTKEKSTTII